MAQIVAKGVPEKYPHFGEVVIHVIGDMVNIRTMRFKKKVNGTYVDAPEVEEELRKDIRRGPTYPLCADPNTMRSALFVLFEWFGEAESCWIKEPKHVSLEGEIEPMESKPGVVY